MWTLLPLYIGGTIILDVPLLFETKMNYLCWETVVVATSQEIQIQRLKARGKLWTIMVQHHHPPPSKRYINDICDTLY